MRAGWWVGMKEGGPWKEEDWRVRREKGEEREKRRHGGSKTREEAERDRCPCTKHSMVKNIEENSKELINVESLNVLWSKASYSPSHRLVGTSLWFGQPLSQNLLLLI